MPPRYPSSSDHEPMMHFRDHPVYATHFVVLVWVVSMIVTTILMFAEAWSVPAWLGFESALVLDGQVWRIFTYGFWNRPSIWFAIDMLMLVWFGRELEKFLGRRGFLRFYGCLYLLSPLLFTVLGFWRPMSLIGQTGSLGIFIAFATLYPRAMMLFNLLAWWVAAILVGLYTLIALGNRDYTTLISLWATTGFAFAYIRHTQGRLPISLPRLPAMRRRQPKLRVLRDREEIPPDSTRAELDALLDKIAEVGMANLTPQEREKLEAARAELLKRSGRKPPQ